MLDALGMVALSGIAACSVFLSLAKRNAPISIDDAKVIWTMHRKDSGCNRREWQFIKRREDKVIGFKCACGYEYKQKRPLLSNKPNHSPECSLHY